MDDDKEKAYQEMFSTLQFEQDNHPSPFATQIVRDNAGRSSIRGDNDFVYLPPSFPKRQCYLVIVHSAGCKPAWNNRIKGKFKSIGEWKPRGGFFLTKEEAANHEGGTVTRPIVSWRSF